MLTRVCRRDSRSDSSTGLMMKSLVPAPEMPVKSVVDEALEQCNTVRTVIVTERVMWEVHMTEGRDLWAHEELRYVDDHCPPEIMDAEAVVDDDEDEAVEPDEVVTAPVMEPATTSEAVSVAAPEETGVTTTLPQMPRMPVRPVPGRPATQTAPDEAPVLEPAAARDGGESARLQEAIAGLVATPRRPGAPEDRRVRRVDSREGGTAAGRRPEDR